MLQNSILHHLYHYESVHVLAFMMHSISFMYPVGVGGQGSGSGGPMRDAENLMKGAHEGQGQLCFLKTGFSLGFSAWHCIANLKKWFDVCTCVVPIQPGLDGGGRRGGHVYIFIYTV